MDIKQIVKAIEVALNTSPPVAIFGFEGQEISNPQDSTFAIYSIRPGKVDELEIGKVGAALRRGLLVASIFTLPHKKGDGLAACAAVEAFFRRATLTEAGERVEFFEPSTEAQSQRQGEKWLKFSVLAPFEVIY